MKLRAQSAALVMIGVWLLVMYILFSFVIIPVSTEISQHGLKSIIEHIWNGPEGAKE